MSRSNRAVELLNEWRDGKVREHHHAWGENCERCTAERDTYEVLVDAAEIMGWI